MYIFWIYFWKRTTTTIKDNFQFELVHLLWIPFHFCCIKMTNSKKSFLRPTTNTGRSMELHKWPWAKSWMPQLRNGLITCCPLANCSTVRPTMERMSSPCTVQLASLSQVQTWFLSALFFFRYCEAALNLKISNKLYNYEEILLNSV